MLPMTKAMVRQIHLSTCIRMRRPSISQGRSRLKTGPTGMSLPNYRLGVRQILMVRVSWFGTIFGCLSMPRPASKTLETKFLGHCGIYVLVSCTAKRTVSKKATMSIGVSSTGFAYHRLPSHLQGTLQLARRLERVGLLRWPLTFLDTPMKKMYRAFS